MSASPPEQPCPHPDPDLGAPRQPHPAKPPQLPARRAGERVRGSLPRVDTKYGTIRLPPPRTIFLLLFLSWRERAHTPHRQRTLAGDPRLIPQMSVFHQGCQPHLLPASSLQATKAAPGDAPGVTKPAAPSPRRGMALEDQPKLSESGDLQSQLPPALRSPVPTLAIRAGAGVGGRA